MLAWLELHGAKTGEGRTRPLIRSTLRSGSGAREPLSVDVVVGAVALQLRERLVDGGEEILSALFLQ